MPGATRSHRWTRPPAFHHLRGRCAGADIAARAASGVATIYRHFPTRADLIVAVYDSPHAALGRWIDLFVDFLVTKHA